MKSCLENKWRRNSLARYLVPFAFSLLAILLAGIAGGPSTPDVDGGAGQDRRIAYLGSGNP